MAWSPDGKALYYNSGTDGSRNVWMAPVDGSPPHPVTDFKDETVFSCGWSPDGTHSACLRQVISYDALMLHFE